MKQIQAEHERLSREADDRDRQRLEREQKEIARQAAHERLEQLKSTALGAKVFATMDEEVTDFLHLIYPSFYMCQCHLLYTVYYFYAN